MEVSAYVEQGSGRRDLPVRQLHMLDGSPGIWEYKFDVKTDLGLEEAQAFQASQSGKFATFLVQGFIVIA